MAAQPEGNYKLKSALITGASRGIGASVAELFARSGYHVIINYNKNTLSANKLCSKIIEAGGSAECIKADVSKAEEVSQIINKLAPLSPDIVINNAGVAHYGLLQDMTDKEYDRVMDVNIKGTFNVCRAVLPHMINKRSGRIINISSVWGRKGAACEAVYSASKAAVIGLTLALAKEVGPSGITVNCICPGVIDTDMISPFSDEDKAALANDTPLMRLGSCEDVASAALFFAENSFITGQILDVSGGFAL